MKNHLVRLKNLPLALQAAGAFSDINQEVERRFAELYLDKQRKVGRDDSDPLEPLDPFQFGCLKWLLGKGAKPKKNILFGFI